mgnify:CR=1 FL=1
MLITPGLLTALGIFILILKLRRDTLRKLLGFDIFLDITVTVILMIAFAGTFSGMMAAIVGGIGFSLALWVTKMVYGYKHLVWVNDSDHLLPTARWESVDGLRHHTPTARKREPTPEEILRGLDT